LPVVTVSKPLQDKVTEWDEYTGRFVAVATVEIRARVSGFIDSIHFKDGQVVKQGDLLFVIDPRPYRLTVDQAKADLDRTRAKLDIATLDLERATPLVRSPDRHRTGIRHQKIDATGCCGGDGVIRGGVEAGPAQSGMDRGSRSDFRRISDRRVDAGNLITGGQTGATLLTSIVTHRPDPLCVRWQRGDFIRYLRLAQAGARQSSRDAQNPVAVRLADETDYKHFGKWISSTTW
jgi:pyruvate/2-oxoglutarate dehydrogenase complex dihydrolipoamide acyltransferase (E2) component